jgi:hypothetical protein
MAIYINVQIFMPAGSIRLWTASNKTACRDGTEIPEKISDAVHIAIR